MASGEHRWKSEISPRTLALCSGSRRVHDTPTLSSFSSRRLAHRKPPPPSPANRSQTAIVADELEIR
ncbi:hypothetical protein U1Q18_016071 [Sarracenia purpurea var. burkii]